MKSELQKKADLPWKLMNLALVIVMADVQSFPVYQDKH